MENKYPIIHDVEQGSKEWLELRFGKFTGSEFHKLMTSGRGGELFGKTALSYIVEVVDEIITSHEFNDFGRTFSSSKALDWGHANENQAREEFENETGIKTETIGFIQIDELFGSSPDFVTEDAIGEIKCPFNPANHTANLFLSTPKDLKENHYDYYIQMQIEMMACNKTKGYFISYDPLKLQKSLRLKVLEFPKDETLCAEIMMRYNEAVKILYSYKKKLYNMIK